MSQAVLNLGGVSYLNSKPLLFGLDADPRVNLKLDVPGRLIDGLRIGAFDVALLPVIDYQQIEGLRIVPAGGIGSDGPTLTVRIFSPIPLEKIEYLACDPDSHTSVALAQIILHKRFGKRPRLEPFQKTTQGEGWGGGSAHLLIGDKVVCAEPRDMPHQLDLGAAWKELTGLPFVFAVWTARPEIDLGDLPARLETAKRQGLSHLEEIIARDAVPRGWPAKLAHEYLSSTLRFDIGPTELTAIRRFHAMAAEMGIIAAPPRDLALYGE